MSPEDLIDMLNSTPSFNDRLVKLKSVKYDFAQDAQVNQILHCFYYDITTEEQACELALFFKQELGDIIICREDSSCLNSLMTIMDCIHNDHRYEDVDITKILKAFRQLKMKYAYECDQEHLMQLFLADPSYKRKFITAIREKEPIRKRKQNNDLEFMSEHLMTKLKV